MILSTRILSTRFLLAHQSAQSISKQPSRLTTTRIPHRAAASALAGLALGLGAAAPAVGSLIAYEPFDYPSGTNVAGHSGGSGFNGPWVNMLGNLGRGTLQAQSPGLSHPLRAGTGNALRATLGQQAMAYVRPFERVLLDSETVWMSMLYRGGSPSGTNESVTLGLVFGNENGYGSVPAIRASVTGFYQLYVEGSSTAINLPVPGPSSSRTDLIVMRYQSLGGNVLQFAAFLNPTNPTNPGTPTITRTVTMSTMEIAAFRMVYAGPPGSSSTSAVLDELGIAATYPGLIPTPGTATVLMLAGIAAVRRRRI